MEGQRFNDGEIKKLTTKILKTPVNSEFYISQMENQRSPWSINGNKIHGGERRD